MVCGGLWWSVVICGGLWYLDSPPVVSVLENRHIIRHCKFDVICNHVYRHV